MNDNTQHEQQASDTWKHISEPLSEVVAHLLLISASRPSKEFLRSCNECLGKEPAGIAKQAAVALHGAGVLSNNQTRKLFAEHEDWISA
jgi:hypothetical protein